MTTITIIVYFILSACDVQRGVSIALFKNVNKQSLCACVVYEFISKRAIDVGEKRK